MDQDSMKQLSDYENVLVTDKNGYIIFCDVAELKVLRAINSWPEDIIGKHFTSFYDSLDETNSSIMKALKHKETSTDYQQIMQTVDGKKIMSINSTFPLTEGDEVVGAIEFSKHIFQKDSIQSLDRIQSHQIYRKNNTFYTIDDFISDNPTIKEIKKRIKKIALN